jgi:phthiodiolone/phenolphthiodiolone dimycocerosates ketoreductase
VLTRDKITEFCAAMDPQAIVDIFPCGTPKQVARKLKGFCEAGVRVYKIMGYGGMAGLRFSATSEQKVRETEDELQRLLEAQ